MIHRQKFLNSQEIVTTMTLGDMPKELAIGYLLNQNSSIYCSIVCHSHCISYRTPEDIQHFYF